MVILKKLVLSILSIFCVAAAMAGQEDINFQMADSVVLSDSAKVKKDKSNKDSKFKQKPAKNKIIK